MCRTPLFYRGLRRVRTALLRPVARTYSQEQRPLPRWKEEGGGGMV